MSNTYTVTAPDLHLNANGPTYALLGASRSETDELRKMLAALTPDMEITFYVREDNTEIDHAWLRATTAASASIFVYTDGVTMEELFVAMEADNNKTAAVSFLGTEDRPIARLINSTGRLISPDMDVLEDRIVSGHT